MRAFAILKSSRTPVFALAGLGIALGVVFAADQWGVEARGAATTLCNGLNVGGDGCSSAYLTKAGFDRVFADVEAASSLTGPERTTLAEKLRVAGAKRLGPAATGERPAVKTRLASDDPVRALIDMDTTLHTTSLDMAAIFSLLIEQPVGSPSDSRMSSLSPDPAHGGT
jgi:hypothetical protein